MHGIKFTAHLAGNQSCVFGNSRHRKFYSHNVVYSLQNMHLIPCMVDRAQENRMNSFSPEWGAFTLEFTKEHLVWKDKACVCLKNSKITQPPQNWLREENSCNCALVKLGKTSSFWNWKENGKIERCRMTQLLRFITQVSQTVCHCSLVWCAEISGG